MNSEISNVIDLNKRDPEKLSKAELIKMVKKLQKKAKKPKIVIVDDDYRPVPPPRTYKPISASSANETIKKPIPKPSKSVKQMVNEYEHLILPPPPHFRDGYKLVPAPRTNETIKKPVPKKYKIVKQMVNEYKDLILPPPPQFRDGYKLVPLQGLTDHFKYKRTKMYEGHQNPRDHHHHHQKKSMKTQLYPLYNSGMTNRFKNQFLLQRLRIEHLR